jgi:hypothetical protein
VATAAEDRAALQRDREARPNVDNRRRGWARTQESLRRVGSLGRTLSEDLLAILGVSLAMILEQLVAVGAVVPA